ncbi:MAG: hypothetical protein H0V53_02535 [Rubrobacter sp.]|nr:hypothetical protein [Rubrobacter sp.]
MPELTCTARRIGDLESRTEEYELTFSVEGGETKALEIKYQAARAYEINRGLDAAVETAREAISSADLDKRPTDESLAQFAWRALQSVKYEEGSPKTSALEL